MSGTHPSNVSSNTIHRKPISRPVNRPAWHELRAYADPSVYTVPQDYQALGSGPVTVREYSRARQRIRLLLNSIAQLLITLLLCVLAGVVLLGYARPVYLTSTKVRAFNALMTIVQIGVSINLASSLRSYAKTLRWRILASSYRSLKEFDLILSCAEQTSVLKLFWQTRRRRHCYIPTATQLVCLVWLSINLASIVGVALLGLTYSMDSSPTSITTEAGEISVLDMSNPLWLQSVNSLSTGSSYTTHWPINGTAKALPGQIFSCEDWTCPGNWAYGFQDKISEPYKSTLPPNSANQSTPVWGPSGRSIHASATCQNATIISEPSIGNSTLDFTFMGVGQSVDLQGQAVPGGLTYVWDSKATCGDDKRCSVIFAYRTAGPELAESQLYVCANTVSQLSGLGVDTLASGQEYAAVFNLTDDNARTLAASIAYTSVTSPGQAYFFALYPQDSSWSELESLSDASDDPVLRMEDLISSFPMAALAAIDQQTWLPWRRNVPGQVPLIPPRLHVSWPASLSILALIPFLQSLSLLAVILWANKAIVKDGSNLSVAKLLAPIVERLGDRGCLLTGDEIVEVLDRSGTKVAYNFDVRRNADTDGRPIMHVGLFEKGRGFTIERTFQEGWYDGDMDKAG